MPEETTSEARVLSILSRMEERQEVGFEQINQRVDTLREDVQAWRQETHGRLSRLEGGFEQMDKRMSKVEGDVGDLRKDMRQVLFAVIGTWVTVMITLLIKLN